ncbi:MAG: 50S ribosomal protein L31e [Candidatus Nanoarchaeia archaeon]|nr:50S ribosomal protein L31e [Candidatus Nanoarchaeia archaeon]
MAKKEEKSKIVIEREYVIPLRKEFQKTPKYKRAKKTISAVKEFLIKHMKSDNVKLGKYLNLKVWENGIKNPPHKVKVKVEKYDDGLVKAELVGAPVEKPEKEKKNAKKTEKPEEKKEDKDKTAKKEDKKQPEDKTEQKKEAKEQENKPAENKLKEEPEKQDKPKKEEKTETATDVIKKETKEKVEKPKTNSK